MEGVIDIGECSSQDIHNNQNQCINMLLSSATVKLNEVQPDEMPR